MINLIKNFIEYFILNFYSKFLLSKPIIKPNTLLFINSGQIGDLVVSSIILENPKYLDNYKNVIFIIKQEYLRLFSDYTGSVKFIGYNYKKYKFSLLYKYKFLCEIRKNGFEKCVNLSAARGILNDEMTLLSGAKESYCLNSNFRYLGEFLGKLLNKKYKIIANKILNEYDKHLELLKNLSHYKNHDFNISNDYTFLINKDINIPGLITEKIISISPFSSDPIRDWPHKNFKRLIQHFKDEFSILLVGSSNQESELKKLQDKCKNVFLVKDLNLNEIAAVLYKSKVFIGLDSGLTHIAAKVGVKSIAIIGGGNFGTFFPFSKFENCDCLYYKMDCFGCEWNCIFDKPYCHENVSVEDVIKAVEKKLIN